MSDIDKAFTEYFFWIWKKLNTTRPELLGLLVELRIQFL